MKRGGRRYGDIDALVCLRDGMLHLGDYDKVFVHEESNPVTDTYIYRVPSGFDRARPISSDMISSVRQVNERYTGPCLDVFLKPGAAKRMGVYCVRVFNRTPSDFKHSDSHD